MILFLRSTAQRRTLEMSVRYAPASGRSEDLHGQRRYVYHLCTDIARITCGALVEGSFNMGRRECFHNVPMP